METEPATVEEKEAVIVSAPELPEVANQMYEYYTLGAGPKAFADSTHGAEVPIVSGTVVAELTPV